MSQQNTVLKFPKDDSGFYEQLKQEVNTLVTHNRHRNAVKFLWIKLFFYSTLFAISYSLLFIIDYSDHSYLLIGNYSVIGMAGILLAFNASHDAVHNTFSKKKYINHFIYNITFNLQGVSGYLWRIRHKASHHVFPNVDGCDADIDNNALIKLSPTHKHFWWHRYQHIYATFLYVFYTLHWIFIKDFIYLRKKSLANLKNQKHSSYKIISVIVWKLFYLFYMIVAPILFMDYELSHVLVSFFIMHGFISVFFVLTLIISHLCMETKFPTPDKNGVLPYGYHRHQLEVSMDYIPTSVMANWVFGGFNSHSAHHLFSSLPHTLYMKITPLIKEIALQYGYTYNELNLVKAIGSHYCYLKKLGANTCHHTAI